MSLLPKQFQLLFLLILFSAASFAQKLTVKNLTVEYQRNPLGIDQPMPRFSWKIYTEIKNTLQSSYEIRVGTDSIKLKTGKQTTWTTGARQTDQSVLVDYEGAELQPNTR